MEFTLLQEEFRLNVGRKFKAQWSEGNLIKIFIEHLLNKVSGK